MTIEFTYLYLKSHTLTFGSYKHLSSDENAIVFYMHDLL